MSECQGCTGADCTTCADGSQFLPGSTSEIIRHIKCGACNYEFDWQCSEDDFVNANCLQCGAHELGVEYVMFPTDGPGFDKGYAKLGLN